MIEAAGNVAWAVARAAIEQPIVTDLSITEGLFIKSYRVPTVGTLLPQHSHAYEHVTVVAAGGVTVWQDGQLLGDRYAPASLVIPAGTKHTFCTLTDHVVVLCIHRVGPDGEPEILEEHQLGA